MFKLGEMKAKSIANGFLAIGLIYVTIILLTTLSQWILVLGTTGPSPLITFNYIMDLINTWLRPILGIYLLKLVCEFLYKILRLAEIIINKNMKSTNEET